MPVTKGTGVVLSYGSAADYSSGSWTPIAQVLDVKPHQQQVDDIETTNMASPSGYKTYEPGLKEPGELSATLQYNASDHAAVLALLGVQRGWKVTFADTSGWKLNAYIKSFQDMVEREKLVTTDVTMKLSGPPLWVASGC